MDWCLVDARLNYAFAASRAFQLPKGPCLVCICIVALQPILSAQRGNFSPRLSQHQFTRLGSAPSTSRQQQHAETMHAPSTPNAHRHLCAVLSMLAASLLFVCQCKTPFVCGCRQSPPLAAAGIYRFTACDSTCIYCTLYFCGLIGDMVVVECECTCAALRDCKEHDRIQNYPRPISARKSHWSRFGLPSNDMMHNTFLRGPKDPILQTYPFSP